MTKQEKVEQLLARYQSDRQRGRMVLASVPAMLLAAFVTMAASGQMSPIVAFGYAGMVTLLYSIAAVPLSMYSENVAWHELRYDLEVGSDVICGRVPVPTYRDYGKRY